MKSKTKKDYNTIKTSAGTLKRLTQPERFVFNDGKEEFEVEIIKKENRD